MVCTIAKNSRLGWHSFALDHTIEEMAEEILNTDKNVPFSQNQVPCNEMYYIVLVGKLNITAALVAQWGVYTIRYPGYHMHLRVGLPLSAGAKLP